MRRRCKLDLEAVYCVRRQASTFESEHSIVMVSRAASASSEMKTLVSLPRFKRILTSGSKYVSMQRLRNWNMSRMVMRAILEREDRNESDSLVNCFTRECKVAPCCRIKS